MTALEDILDWSRSPNRPMWQRDTLRRLVTQQELTDVDLTELASLCLQQHGASEVAAPAPEPSPLTANHLPATNANSERVQILALRDVQGVNALTENQPLSFQPDGMTVVFGYNGAGKSGYARILRALCHTRHPGEEILQDAFAAGDRPTPSAVINFRIGDVDQSEPWRQGQSSHGALAQASFFDADCASVHVSGTNELAFTPAGLDILPSLVTVCRSVAEEIARLTTEREREQPITMSEPGATEGTVVRTMLEELDAESDIEPLELLAELTEHDLLRIQQLNEALATNPAQRAREIRKSIGRLNQLKGNIEEAERTLSGAATEVLHVRLKEAVIKKGASDTAAELAFEGQPLAGTGGDVWKELWDSARRYSHQHAYPDMTFPVVADDARCVFCLQPLGPDARERLIQFDAFVQDDTQAAATEAAASLAKSLGKIEGLVVGIVAHRASLPDLPNEFNDVRKTIRRFHWSAWRARRTIVRACANREWTVPNTLSPSPQEDLARVIESMDSRAAELESAASGESSDELIRERDELLARQWLQGVIDDVRFEIVRLGALASLEAAKQDTDTRNITIKSGQLADAYVTEVLRDTLAEEIRAFGAIHVQVELETPGGRLGQKQFRIGLRDANPGTNVAKILSEGEFRCVAIAGFLAELATEQSGSAIILDDPVSSLDHNWRRLVAKRLAQLAVDRQVIVFTHDIGFYSDLVGFCDGRVECRQEYVTRSAGSPGEVAKGAPWVAMNIKSRIGFLRARLQDAEAALARGGRLEYEPQAQSLYGLLRESWERAIEEVLLNGVIKRFDREVRTQPLRKLIDINEADIRAVDDGMTKTSRFLIGHDQPEAVAEPVPEPDEIRQDIAALENWVAAVRGRR